MWIWKETFLSTGGKKKQQTNKQTMKEKKKNDRMHHYFCSKLLFEHDFTINDTFSH